MTYSKAIAIIDGTRQEIITNSTELDKALKKLEHEIAPWFKTEDKKSFQDFKNSELAHFTARVTQFEEKKRKGQLNAENLKVETSEITDSALKILIKLEEKITDIYLEQIKNGTYPEVNFEEIELLSNKSHTPFLKSFAFVFETHKKEVKDFKNDITQYKEKEQQSKIDISNFEKKVEELENSITQYKEKEQGLKKDVSNFEKKVEELENSITQYQEKENTLNNSINNLEKERDEYKDIASKYQKAEPGVNMYISKLQGDISKLQGDISKLKNDINDKTDRLKRSKIIKWVLGIVITLLSSLLLFKYYYQQPQDNSPNNFVDVQPRKDSTYSSNTSDTKQVDIHTGSTNSTNFPNISAGDPPPPPNIDTPKIYFCIIENNKASKEDIIKALKLEEIYHNVKFESNEKFSGDETDKRIGYHFIKVVPIHENSVSIFYKNNKLKDFEEKGVDIKISKLDFNTLIPEILKTSKK
jgi:predicted  nucleic acid-binding Zn-ribbon protein